MTIGNYQRKFSSSLFLGTSNYCSSKSNLSTKSTFLAIIVGYREIGTSRASSQSYIIIGKETPFNIFKL